MIGYKKKTQAELAWSAIKKVLSAKVNLEVALYRERRMNEELAVLWPAFRTALNGGRVLGVDPEQERWIADALEQIKELEA